MDDQFFGCLLGTAIGDALGLPCEALSPQKQRKRFGEIDGHRLIFGRGMYSDDAEHTLMTAQALIASRGESEAFQNALARQLRGWILLLPGGVGLATLKACWRLVFGVPPCRSGVFSAGNGPAMRSAILGVFAAKKALSDEQLIELNCVSAHLTHTDPKAEGGALLIAAAARFSVTAAQVSPIAFCESLQAFIARGAFDDELLRLLEAVETSVAGGESTSAFCLSQGWTRGASGYIYHTVPAALHAWLSHPQNYEAGVLEIIRCGGDTDSTAAIVGGLIGARVGAEKIPLAWRNGLLEWPRGAHWMQNCAARLDAVCHGENAAPLPTFWPGVLARNIFFLLVVFAHGLRRILPF
jgi:ADP-ribosyl-[dinitrogen reductase] hydrolase